MRAGSPDSCGRPRRSTTDLGRCRPSGGHDPVPSAVPPPILRGRSSLSAFLPASVSDIELPLRFGSTCSALRRCAQAATMASADCRLPAHLGHSVGRLSRGKTRDLPPTYPPHLQPSVRVAIGLQRSVPPLPPPAASYAVRVPRAGSPPTAAFPLHPCHAVAVRLGVPTTRVFGGIPTPLVTSRSAFASRLSDVLTDVGAPCPAHTVPDEKRVGSRDDHRIDKRGDARFDVLVALDM